MKRDLRAAASEVAQAQDRLVLQASDLSLETLAAMVRSAQIDVGPDFQRRQRWEPERQSSLIESFLLNIPVPPIYLAEEESGVYTVIDGQQRLRAIKAFMWDELALVGLETLRDLVGFKFSELPPSIQNPLKIRPYLRAVTLLRQSDPGLRYEVFTRLNTGGVRLNPQEIRNVAYRGPLNELIYTLSDDPFLKRRLKITSEKSAAYSDMSNAEYVLRFLTLLDTWEDFSGDFSKSMNDYMVANRFIRQQSGQRLGQAFTWAIRGCERIWDDHAFERPVGNGWRAQALAGLYDAEMVGVSGVTTVQLDKLHERREEVVRGTRKLFEDPEFEAAVRVGTNTPSRVRYRISRMRDLLSKLAD
jgi:hypothetical protein